MKPTLQFSDEADHHSRLRHSRRTLGIRSRSLLRCIEDAVTHPTVLGVAAITSGLGGVAAIVGTISIVFG